ncbi:MAG: maleylpyruvate isomerase family mycothiol-dependent enzyme [Ilumatobacteraceae bacterium]|nr:maleylpyruvate isomerase family mycothiol-dependent enzyme [Ilumatobacteraceae bacterium]
MPADGRDLDRDVELAAGAHQQLLAALDAQRDDLEVRATSALPEWSVGHVLAHITNSGDGHARLFVAAARGEVGDQYPGGLDQRTVEIEEAAGRSAEEHIDALRRSVWHLESMWAASSWEGRGRLSHGAEVSLRDLPFLRSREVLLHHVDLDIGFGFDDLPSLYIRLELARLEMLWKARQPMGMTAIPAAARQAPPPERLAWLTGRGEIDGLGPADVF